MEIGLPELPVEGEGSRRAGHVITEQLWPGAPTPKKSDDCLAPNALEEQLRRYRQLRRRPSRALVIAQPAPAPARGRAFAVIPGTKARQPVSVLEADSAVWSIPVRQALQTLAWARVAVGGVHIKSVRSTGVWVDRGPTFAGVWLRPTPGFPNQLFGALKLDVEPLLGIPVVARVLHEGAGLPGDLVRIVIEFLVPRPGEHANTAVW